MVESDGLENRYGRKSIESSNLSLSAILPRAITFKPEGEGYRNFREEWRKYYEANGFKVLRHRRNEERGKYYEANSFKVLRHRRN